MRIIAVIALALSSMTIGWLVAKADIPLISVQDDPQTGCQYMVNRNGGITPRIASDYMHMGCNGYEGQE